MTTADTSTITRCVNLVRRAVRPGEPLRVLVLGDPDARICGAVAAIGDIVECCPDRQVGRRPVRAHVRLVSESLTRLLEGDDHWDLLIAIDGWSRILQTHPPRVQNQLTDWMRRNIEIVMVEAPRDVISPSQNDRGPFTVQDVLGGFSFLAEATLAEQPRALVTPFIFASDHHLLVGDEWIGVDRIHRMSSPVDAVNKTVRTFRIQGLGIVKVECASSDYFERGQILGEAAFLMSADPSIRADLDLPEVDTLVSGRAVITMAREDIRGDAGNELPVDVKLGGVLAMAGRYASHGIFHNDLRPWNILWHGHEARFIDFSETSAFDDDVADLPQVLALSGTLAAIATDEIRYGEDFHTDVLDVAATAGLGDRWPLERLLTTPWSAVSRLEVGRDVHQGMGAADIIRRVLEMTVD